MNRHPFRWDAFIFGLFFLAVLGQWAVWEQDLLATEDLAYLAAAALIVLGVMGILATAISARKPRTAPFTPEPAPETDDHDPAGVPGPGRHDDTEDTP